MSDDEMVLWGSIGGWSEQLGITEEILRERLKSLPSRDRLAADPKNPRFKVLTQSYAEPDVREAVADLVPLWPAEKLAELSRKTTTKKPPR